MGSDVTRIGDQPTKGRFVATDGTVYEATKDASGKVTLGSVISAPGIPSGMGDGSRGDPSRPQPDAQRVTATRDFGEINAPRDGVTIPASHRDFTAPRGARRADPDEMRAAENPTKLVDGIVTEAVDLLEPERAARVHDVRSRRLEMMGGAEPGWVDHSWD
jgi:hypothetical protein